MRRFTTITLLACLITAPAFADTVTGRVVAFDRVSKVLVLEDKTIWKLNGPELVIPDEVAAGSTVTIDYQSSGDNGFLKADKVTVTEG